MHLDEHYRHLEEAASEARNFLLQKNNEAFEGFEDSNEARRAVSRAISRRLAERRAEFQDYLAKAGKKSYDADVERIVVTSSFFRTIGRLFPPNRRWTVGTMYDLMSNVVSGKSLCLL